MVKSIVFLRKISLRSNPSFATYNEIWVKNMAFSSFGKWEIMAIFSRSNKI